MSELLLPSPLAWNTALIDQLFQPYDAKAITSIIVSERCPLDKLVWLGSVMGQYTVKGGYQFLLEEELLNQPGSSNRDAMQQVWREIWSLVVPKKIHMFIW